ncbi:MAG TPA: DUF3570 domain-containing protein [Myxococcales bacterium]|nr:DUF3570 domain-containing protein [Myxococcales bacterium]
MLSLALPLLDLLALCLLLLVLARSALAQEAPVSSPSSLFLVHQPDRYVAVDLLAFSQWDPGGGDPLVDEGFRYEALSVDARFKVTDDVYVRGTAVVAYLQNDPLLTLPNSIANAHVTSASTDFVTLDSSLATDLISPDGKWIFSPGFFYHHQWAFLVGGMDLDLRHVMAGGDAVLRLGYNGRYASIHQVKWDGSPVYGDDRITNNAVLSWTQVLSPKLVANVGLQYTNQTGLLSSTLQFVGLYDAAGQPVELVDEVLPRERNRGQLDLRARYTPSVGTSFGLDLSGYYDDWDLLNLAIEPSFETPIWGGARLRVWYRLSDQKGTRYFDPTPQTVQPYMTQNSNLGTWVDQSPGMLVLVPLGERGGAQWLLRASLLGFYRTDRIFGAGGSLGFSVEW